MPHYDYRCNDCKKDFNQVLSIAANERGEVKCPHCGSRNVEQQYSDFFAITSKKSA